ncbi:MAG: peptidoglycan-associated lipoprotein Pal [Proteobacteria bacterium]|nr:peptidoglycan-associated lipoprotein Pal [Pseudomonadota bacterium]
MKIRKILDLCLMTVLCGTLVAGCSSTGKNKHGAAGVEDGSKAYSSGLGEEQGFGGEGGSDADKLKAPHNQVYYFDYDSNSIHEEDRPSITAQAAYLAAHSSDTVVLLGNTDERGSREYNMALGERRANAVADLMMVDGVQKRQICVISYGAERPAAVGHDDNAYRLNRRVELKYEKFTRNANGACVLR